MEKTLGRNVARHIKETKATEESISKAIKSAVANGKAAVTMHQTTVNRIKLASASVTLVKLEALAAGMGYEAWELLHEQFSPSDKLLAIPISAIGRPAAKAAQGIAKGLTDERTKVGSIADRSAHRTGPIHEQGSGQRNAPRGTKAAARKTAKTDKTR